MKRRIIIPIVIIVVLAGIGIKCIYPLVREKIYLIRCTTREYIPISIGGTPDISRECLVIWNN